MKYELQAFNKKKVEYIQNKYKVKETKTANKKKEESYIEKERKKLERRKKILEYKEALDSNRINEEDIPKEYVDELIKIYNEKINEAQRKIDHI